LRHFQFGLSGLALFFSFSFWAFSFFEIGSISCYTPKKKTLIWKLKHSKRKRPNWTWQTKPQRVDAELQQLKTD
jgi:hypothetical protein